MVRTAATAKDEAEEENKRKTTSKKKTNVTGVWPCKINGCNKQFAREADLKRHQRTTKTHSMPGFACPQCEATFTRTDALRRHQKSRHNGVVIELSDAEQQKDMGTQSRSRSGTPSSKGKEKSISSSSTETSGFLPYYRQHTATTSGYPPSVGPSQAQFNHAIAHPTSSTRNWPPPPPWATETTSQPVGQIPYSTSGPPPPVYYSPYYRVNNGALPPQEPAGVLPQKDDGQSDSHCISNPSSYHAAPQLIQDHSIDPSLDLRPNIVNTIQQNNNPLRKEELQICPPTIEGVNGQDELPTESASLDSMAPTIVSSPSHHSTSSDADGETDLEADEEQSDLSGLTSMEQMVTEDGEPMLNPAELLTQESLASPPP